VNPCPYRRYRRLSPDDRYGGSLTVSLRDKTRKLQVDGWLPGVKVKSTIATSDVYLAVAHSQAVSARQNPSGPHSKCFPPID